MNAAFPNFSNMPSIDQFPQGMDFLKQFWAQGAAAPTAAAPAATPAFQQAMGQYFLPTFDVEELDKRIGDLRTVLQFMDLNANMVRQSLSALEVQRNTIAALHTMAQTKPSDAAQPTSPVHAAMPWLNAWQQMMQTATAPVPTAQQTSAPAPTKPSKNSDIEPKPPAKPRAKTAAKTASAKKALQGGQV